MYKPDTFERLKRHVDTAAENSILKSLSDALSSSYEQSTLNWLSSRLLYITQQSRLYRWFTTEPDPNVIVIDLRETYTVGPLLSVLDIVVPRAEQVWRESGLASAVERLERILSGSKFAQLVVTVLEPPDPPEKDDQRRL